MARKSRAAAGVGTQAKKIVVELSVLKLNDLIIRFVGGAWSATAVYTLTDEAETTRRNGILEYPTAGKTFLEDVRASVIAAIELKEGLA